VLINAHGGGFFVGAAYNGQVEAVPMADTGKVKVVAVDYRMAPEHIYPAASEDMEAVYRHVLKTTTPDKVGFYGCSAGGTLVGQMIPWLREKKLPLPGAIGVFCTGLMGTFWYGGDAAQVSGLLNARPPMQGAPAPRWRPYFDGIDTNNPLITPALFPDTLVGYPPTLVVTGTRDVAMSNALITHARLLTAGVEAELFVQEGLGHGHFTLMPGTPEAATAHEIMWRFFDRQLAR
jgi:acetyl esterase/lipase